MHWTALELGPEFHNVTLLQRKSIYVGNDISYLSVINKDLEKGVHKQNAIR